MLEITELLLFYQLFSKNSLNYLKSKVCVCMCICVCVCGCVHACMCAYVWMCVCRCVCIYLCVCMYMYVFVCMWMCVCVFVRKQVHIHEWHPMKVTTLTPSDSQSPKPHLFRTDVILRNSPAWQSVKVWGQLFTNTSQWLFRFLGKYQWCIGVVWYFFFPPT